MKIRFMSILYFNALQRAVVFPFAALILSGCASASYQSNSQDNSPRPPDYPIPVYTEDESVPRPCRIIGTVAENAGKFTMFGGTSEKEMTDVMRRAHEAGADVVKFTALDKPSFSNPNFRMTAELLRYTDVWETVHISEADFEKYLKARPQALDSIEGNWISGGPDPHCIGIIRDKSRPGRDFVAFMLRSPSLAWPAGTKKMDIRRGLERSGYVLTYYVDDFAPREVPIVLKERNSFSFLLEEEEGNNLISYTRYQMR
jgi:hypothetical protein